MNSFLLFVLAVLAIGLPVMFLYRRHQNKKAEREMRELSTSMDTSVEGVRNMTGSNYTARRREKSKADLRVVDKPAQQPPADANPDDVMFFSAAALSGAPVPVIEPHHTPEFKGKGGTHDGAGASGDWERPSQDYANTRDSGVSSARNSDTGSSRDTDSGSSSRDSDSGGSSGSSDSGSSSSSND